MEAIQTISEAKWEYRGWKIETTSTGLFQAVRFRPTKWFVATSLTAAQKAIDRRENILQAPRLK